MLLGALSIWGCSAPGTRNGPPGGSAPAPAGPHLFVLGTVQDGGLPHASCRCARCGSARVDPSRKRYVASLALRLPARGETYLIDATPDLREQLHRLATAGSGSASPAGAVDRRPLDGVLLTHAHLGHYTGLAFFGYEAVHTRHLPVYGTGRMTGYLASNGPWDQLVRLENVELREVIPGEPFRLGGVEVTPVPVPHRDEYSDTVAYRLRGDRRTLLYVPDTEPWHAWPAEALDRLFRGVDVALLDGTFYSERELPGREVSEIGHPLITSTLELLRERVEAGDLEVRFTHLNHSNPALDPGSPERARIESLGFRVLEEGSVIPL